MHAAPALDAWVPGGSAGAAFGGEAVEQGPAWSSIIAVGGYDGGSRLESLGGSGGAAEPEVLAPASREDAAHFAASLVARMLEAAPTLGPLEVRHILIATADRIQGASPIRQGYGVLNARRALAEAGRDPHRYRSARGTPPRIEGRHLVFRFRDDRAREVVLYGDLAGHMAVVGRLARDQEGIFTVRVPTPLPGRYRYKFIVDDARWIEDPAHGLVEDDGFGGFNSLLHVGWDLR